MGHKGLIVPTEGPLLQALSRSGPAEGFLTYVQDKRGSVEELFLSAAHATLYKEIVSFQLILLVGRGMIYEGSFSDLLYFTEQDLIRARAFEPIAAVRSALK